MRNESLNHARWGFEVVEAKIIRVLKVECGLACRGLGPTVVASDSNLPFLYKDTDSIWSRGTTSHALILLIVHVLDYFLDVHNHIFVTE